MEKIEIVRFDAKNHGCYNNIYFIVHKVVDDKFKFKTQKQQKNLANHGNREQPKDRKAARIVETKGVEVDTTFKGRGAKDEYDPIR